MANAQPMEVEGGCQWSEDDRKVIEDYRQWLLDESERLEKFQDKPNEVKWIKQPRHPKLLLDDEPKTSKKLQGEKLNKYLKAHVINTSSAATAWPKAPLNFNRQDITRYLVDGWTVIKKKQSELLHGYTQYGLYLEKARHFFDVEKKGRETWEGWLKDNIGISQSYSRKIVTVSKIVRGFPKLQRVGLSFLEVYELRKNIEQLLTTNEAAAKYWREKP